jgi:hypothetical protein
MLQKFKTTTYATLLLIGVFVLPYAGNVADVDAENYNCRGSKKQVRQCLKAVISERDAKIAEMEEATNKNDEAILNAAKDFICTNQTTLDNTFPSERYYQYLRELLSCDQ